MTFRPPRFLCHPGQSFAPKTLFPLVPRLGADSVLLTQRSEIERLHRSHRKLHSLFHRYTFLPRHAEVLPHHTTQKCYLCIEPIVLPMFATFTFQRLRGRNGKTRK